MRCTKLLQILSKILRIIVLIAVRKYFFTFSDIFAKDPVTSEIIMGKLIEDHFERQARKEEVLECMRNDDWKGVLDHFSRPGDKYHDPMLVWIRPSLEAIKFIEFELKRLITLLKPSRL